MTDALGASTDSPPGGDTPPTLGEVFAACDTLSPGARLALAALLPSAPGRPPAVLPGEIASRPLPADPARRAALRPVIEADLGPATLAELGALRLRQVVPALAGRAGPVEPGPTSTRLRRLLERNGATSWAALGDLTVDDVAAWPGVGPNLTATLVGVAVDAGLRLLADRVPADGAPRAGEGEGPGGDDLRLLLDHEARQGGRALRQAIERWAGAAAPEPVRAAAGRLLRLPPPDDPVLAWLDGVLAAAGDHRDRAVFVHAVLRPAGGPSRGALAEALGVGAVRVRQLVGRAGERVAAASAAVPGGVARLRDELARRLEAAAPVRAADDLLAAAGLPALPDTRSLLLLWLAGPYLTVPGHPGWLAADPPGLLAETRRMLAEDGGARPADDVRRGLHLAGVPAAHVDAWLGRQPVIGVDGLLVLTTGSPADVAERALFAAGRAMTARQVAAAVWPDAATGAAADHDALERALHRDPRFVRVGAEEFELAEWGSEPYRDLPAGLTPTGDEADRCWLEVEVDEALLAGVAAPVPVPLAAGLGLQRGARRTFATKFGPVALAYDGGRPVRGTLRPVALAAGAGPGDVLALGFHGGDGSATVRLIPSAPLDRTA